MKKTLKQVFSFVLVIAIVLTSLQVSQVRIKAEDAAGISVQISLQMENTFAVVPQTISLTGQEAEQYGYTDAEVGVTAMDALVVAHKLFFEDLFDEETAYDSLSMNSSGWITNVMGIETGNFGFAVNGGLSKDAEGNSYVVTNAPLTSGDQIEFFLYQDSMALDNYGSFEESGVRVTKTDAIQGIEKKLNLTGYCIGWYGYLSDEEIADKAAGLEDASISIYNDEMELVKEEAAVSGKNGEVSLTFDKPGTYYVSAWTDPEDDIPLIMPWLMVNVHEYVAPQIKEAYKTKQVMGSKVGSKISFDTKDMYVDENGLLEYEFVVDGETVTDVKNGVIEYTPKTSGLHSIIIKAKDQKTVLDDICIEIYAVEKSQITLSPMTNDAIVDIQSGSRVSHYYGWDTIEGNQIQFVATNTNPGEKIIYSTSYGTIDQNGLLSLGNYENGRYVYVTAKNEDETVSEEYCLILQNIQFREESVSAALSTDGSVAKTTTSMYYYISNQTKLELADPSIADVSISYSTLTIIPKKPGKTTLKASWTENENLSDTMEVVVTGAAVVTADGSDAVLTAAGESKQLVAFGETEDETFTWSSSDETVATVDENGFVTPVKEGVALITATSSRKVEEESIKGALLAQVREAGAPYLQSMNLSSYSSFVTTADSVKLADQSSYFVPAKKKYELTSTSAILYNFVFTPVFAENYEAVSYFTDIAGKTQEKKMTSGVATTLTDALTAGKSEIRIQVTKKDDEAAMTEYVYDITCPVADTKTITQMSVLPGGVAANTVPTYKGKAEVTLFRGETTTTGFTSSVNDYVAYVFDRTESITLKPTFGNKNEKVRMYINGQKEDAVQVQSAVNAAPITVSHTDDTTVTFEVVSAKTALAAKEAEEDMFAEPEAVYTITFKPVVADAVDMVLSDVTVDNGEFYRPGFNKDLHTSQGILVDENATLTTVSASAPAYAKVYHTSVEDANLLVGELNGDKKTYTFNIGVGKSLTVYLVDEESGAKYTYIFSCNRHGNTKILPSEIVDYLCIGSQYTNAAAYGMTPERTLVANGDLSNAIGGSVLSLGNFGGYITYRFNDPIKNDEKNPYGIDFMVYGNANSGPSFAEPGAVEVSKDGKTWYKLAGAMHYENNCDWNYEMTYTKTADGKTAWTDNRGGSTTTARSYPLASNYVYHDFSNKEEEEITLSGVRLFVGNVNNYGGTTADFAPQPDWGYTDSLPNEKQTGVAGNPYDGEKKAGSAFDLDWAVDDNGMPVSIDEVSYVKVVTATNIDSGAYGEKSTEVQTVARTINQTEESLGATEMPTEILVDGAPVELKEGQNIYDVSYLGEFDVNVTADCDNIYINDTRTNTRAYEVAPEKGIIRVVLQDKQKAPYICYLVLHANTDQPKAEEVIEMIKNLDASKDDYKESLKQARDAYDALPESAKQLVTNYASLTLLEEKQKDEETKDVMPKVQSVIDKITSIGNVTVNSEKQIKEAESAYEALSDQEKKLVTNANDLVRAKARFEALKEAKAEADKKAQEDEKQAAEEEKEKNKPIVLDKTVVTTKLDSDKLKVTIKVKKVDKAVGYEIYRLDDKKKEKKLITTLSGEESYVDESVENGKNYTYSAIAICYQNDKKVSSPESQVSKVKVVLKAPKLKSAKKSKKNVTMKWNKISAADGYKIVYSNKKNGKYSLAMLVDKNTTTATCKNSKVMKNKKLYIKICAFTYVNGKKVYGQMSASKKVK